MKKIIMVLIALLLGISMIGCTNEQDTSSAEASQEEKVIKEEGSAAQEEIKQQGTSGSEVYQEVKNTKKDEKNAFEKYTKLIGLSKEEIIKAMGEEPSSADEGGLDFSNGGIRVWFGNGGKTANEVFMDSSDIDFNGARIGEKIGEFKNVFGKIVVEDTGSAYSNFDYEGLVIHVQYDPSTEKVVAVYIMKEWK
ncbi:hypothetical protein IZY60_02220 [Lutibacter sp. B2]|nr:hypothetical protein [Lutibacter sp. B2]